MLDLFTCKHHMSFFYLTDSELCETFVHEFFSEWSFSNTWYVDLKSYLLKPNIKHRAISIGRQRYVCISRNEGGS